MDNTCKWLKWNFTVYPIQGVEWNNCAGIYIFARLGHQNQSTALYIGQTDNFSDRIPSHEKLDKARQYGATHIHAIHVPKQFDRDRIEKQLIRVCQPPLNTQHRDS